MRVRGIHHDHVHFSRHQFLGALQKVAGRSHRRAHPQASLLIFGRVRILQLLLNVLHRDQALERVLIVHHQQLLHAMPVQDLLRFLERSAHRDRDQILLGHHLRDRQVIAGLEAQVAIGKNANQLSAFRDWNP